MDTDPFSKIMTNYYQKKEETTHVLNQVKENLSYMA